MQIIPLGDQFIQYNESIAALREMLANSAAVPTIMSQPTLLFQSQNSESSMKHKEVVSKKI